MKIKKEAKLVRAEKVSNAGGKFAGVEFRAIDGSAYFKLPIDQYPTREEIVFTDYVLADKSKRHEFSRDDAWTNVKTLGGRVVKVKVPV